MQNPQDETPSPKQDTFLQKREDGGSHRTRNELRAAVRIMKRTRQCAAELKWESSFPKQSKGVHHRGAKCGGRKTLASPAQQDARRGSERALQISPLSSRLLEGRCQSPPAFFAGLSKSCLRNPPIPCPIGAQTSTTSCPRPANPQIWYDSTTIDAHCMHRGSLKHQ